MLRATASTLYLNTISFFQNVNELTRHFKNTLNLVLTYGTS